jgi:hypothetical protein
MQRSIVLAVAAAATLLTAGTAHAARVDWSIGINVPPVAAVVGGPAYYPTPAYYNAPGYYDNAPAYYAPPVYAPPVVYAPRPRIWLPPPPPLPRIGWGWGWDHRGWDRRGWDHRGEDHDGHAGWRR